MSLRRPGDSMLVAGSFVFVIVVTIALYRDSFEELENAIEESNNIRQEAHERARA